MSDADLPLPERYVDARRVARGGMGEVWHARDTRLDRDVAIKVLAPGDGLESEGTRRERFRRESRAIAQLSTHPGVVTIYDEGEVDDGRPYQAMEWMPGGTLADRLAASQPIDRSELLEALARVAAALDSAHAAGIVHRDVKPGNVMFDAEGRARIGDFGIARRDGDPSVTLTQVGAVVGTAGYIAPEQARADGAVPASDQYALMSIAFQALTGRRPFARDSAIAELAAHVGDPVPSAASLEPGLPPEVDDVFARALAKDATDRYPTCAAAVAALDDALTNVAPTVPIATVAAPRRAEAPPARAVTSRRPRRLLPVVAVLLLLAVLGALAVQAANDGSGDDDPVAPERTTTSEEPEATPTETEPTNTREEPEPEPAPEPEPVEQPQLDADEARRLNDEAFAALQAGDYERALALALEALPALSGVAPFEAYAAYNAGAALVALGRCEEALPYLDRSEALQGQRDEIDEARRQCSDRSNGNGKAKGRDKDREDDD